MKNEIEAKFLSVNKELIRIKLRNIGFELKVSEYLMKRKTFDFPKIEGRKKWGRVRQEANKITMTIKEIIGQGINDTYEIELIVNNFDDACLFLEACGIKAKAFQENLREVWFQNESEVFIDTWPGLDSFIEIESKDEAAVQKISADLDLDYKKAVFGSIDLIYEKVLGISSKEIINLPRITFENFPKKNTA